MSSFLDTNAGDDGFGLENLPYGIFSTDENTKPRPGVAIANHVLDLSAVSHLFTGPRMAAAAGTVFHSEHLNDFMALGPACWDETRSRIRELLSAEESAVRDDPRLRLQALIRKSEAQMHLPAVIGDYTDFYSSIDHARNVGTMFRGGSSPLLPNWKHLPVGYHGRASSVVVSGTGIRRPCGQTRPDDTSPPLFGPSQRLDFELEVAFFVGSPATALGQSVPIDDAEQHIFGLVLLNDWSARDVQKWEYVPLGPFNSKNFGTSISAWIVPLQALHPFRIPHVRQEPQPLPYLVAGGGDFNIDIRLAVDIVPNGDNGANMAARTRVTNSNLKYTYWTMKQQLAHHTSTGCNLRPGDLIASGTVSGPEAHEFGSLLELSWNGTKPVRLNDGSTRTFLQDGDITILSGMGVREDGTRVAFGDCVGQILPPLI